METLINKRLKIRSIFEKQAEIVEANIEAGSNIETSLLQLEDRFKCLLNIDEKIEAAYIKAGVDEEDLETVFKFRDIMTELRGKVKESPITAKPTPTSRHLPPMQLTKFTGDPREFLNFWGHFEKIHTDTTLNKVDKFLYLKQCCEDKAGRLINTFPVNESSYDIAIETLKSRFGQKKFLIELYVRELLKLVLAKSSISLPELYDSLEAQLRALDTLGVTSEHFESMLYPLVEASLPKDTLINWERHRSNSNKEQNIKDMLKFLKNEVESIERLKLAKSLTEEPDNNNMTGAVLFTAGKQKIRDHKIKNSPPIVVCSHCKKTNHSLALCFSARRLSLEERNNMCKKEKLCRLCLKSNHDTEKCRSKNLCDICDGNHHIFLCPNKKGAEQSTNCHIVQNKAVYLPMVNCQIRASNNEVMTARVLCDSGSQISFIRKDFAVMCSLKESGKINLSTNVFGGVKLTPSKCIIFSAELIKGAFSLYTELTGVPTISAYESPMLDVNLLNELKEKGISISNEPTKSSQIDILLGADYLGNIQTGNQMLTKAGPLAIETKLGWTIMGSCQRETKSSYSCLHVSDLWTLDNIGITDNSSDTKDDSISDFQSSIVFKDNRYSVKLPWKNGHPELGNNKNTALKRLHNVKKQLGVNFDKYDEAFNSWQEEGIIEIAPPITSLSNTHYLGHRPVFKRNSTKIRPVFDGSAKSETGVSINECLNTGPNLLSKIPIALTRFRAHKNAIIADIRKAFLMIAVNEEDRNYLRFLWFKNDKVVEYRFCRVPFGLTSSPFLMSATLHYHLNLQIPSNIVNILKSGFYMDDLAVSLPNDLDINFFKNEATRILAEAGFELTSWASNCEPVDEPSTILGYNWDTRKDELFLNYSPKIELDNGVYTKRSLLSQAQSIFDPLGYLCPYLVTIKLVIQEIWKLKIPWDTTLPDDFVNKFKEWNSQLPFINQCRIPRDLSGGFPEADKSLHVFVDASKSIYAACVFLRSEYCGKVTVQLILAKNRIAPLEKTSIPRLELLAALIGSRIYNNLVKDLCWEDIPTYFWSDSQVVLYWLKNPTGWKNFVQNRVVEILKNSNGNEWRHIPGSLNPADLPSRGCTIEQLLESKWWNGPEWLKGSKNEWPNDLIIPSPEVDTERNPKNFVTLLANTSETSDNLCKYFSSFYKTVRMIGWIFRFVRNAKGNKLQGPLTNQELLNARIAAYKYIQNTGITEAHTKGLQIELNKQNLFEVLTRVTENPKAPLVRKNILLPGDHILVKRMIHEIHIEQGHSGVLTLISKLREKYWIPKARQNVKKIINNCLVCRKFKCKAFDVKNSTLPSSRTEIGPCFSVCGIDNFGPLFTKDSGKVWVTLFTCAVYRAVHLEIVHSLSTEAFFQAFRRFVARRGRPKTIYTDNGTNFVGASNFLSFTSKANIKWIHNPPKAPFYGGFFERMVRTCKEVLRKTLGKAYLTTNELDTLLCEVEAVVNSRPITYVSEDPKELSALTPSFFLQDSAVVDTHDFDLVDTQFLSDRAKYVCKVRQDLKNRFKQEYLPLLLQFPEKSVREPKVGELVLIHDESKRQLWPTGKIIKIFNGRNNEPRVAEVRTKSGCLTRPLQKLYPLEIFSNDIIKDVESKISRTGRQIKKPVRFLD